MEDDDIDRSQWLPPKEPLFNKFRLAKPDISIERSCEDCGGAGAINNHRCFTCKGRGWLLTAWRGDGLDPVEGIKYGQTKTRNILAYLHHTHIITDQHAHDGRTYEIWYEIFRASSTQEKRQLYGAVRGEPAAEGLSEHGFSLLVQMMAIDHHNAIKRTLFTLQNEDTRAAARSNSEAYQRSFDKLSELIPQIREKLKAERDKRPEPEADHEQR